MNRSDIERIAQSQGHTAIFRRISPVEARVWASNGRAGRALGYLSGIQRMTEDEFAGCMRAAFRRKAR